jgi:hypothetical protein
MTGHFTRQSPHFVHLLQAVLPTESSKFITGKPGLQLFADFIPAAQLKTINASHFLSAFC